MIFYLAARKLYRVADSILLRHLSPQGRAQRWLWQCAKRLFPTRVKVPAASQLAPSARRRMLGPAGLPSWVENEVTQLARYEPMLAYLIGPDAMVRQHFIPWDMSEPGKRYAHARRRFRRSYACLLLAGGDAADWPPLGTLVQPLAVVAVERDPHLARRARRAGADFACLSSRGLAANAYCAVLARLVLQVAPARVVPTRHPLVVRCLERHGRALATVTDVAPPWPAVGGGGLPPRKASVR